RVRRRHAGGHRLDLHPRAAAVPAGWRHKMRNPVDLWVYLSASPLIWLTMTLCTWIVAAELSIRLKRHPLASPVLSSIVVLSLALWLFDVPYGTFFAGAQFCHFLLGAATVAMP